MKYQVKDINLASQGKNQIRWAERHMSALMIIKERFKREKPLKDLRIGMALHVTKETAVLVETLIAGGAEIAICSCNPLSTQDDVAAYLAKKGISVFAYKGENKEDYYKFIKAVIAQKPHLTIDDGCDLVSEIHIHHKALIPKIIGGCEETTTGVNRLKAMEKDNALAYPIIAINDNQTKHLFDNYYGTGQSTWDGILRGTNILIAGKTVVIAGYGDCGKGVALRAKGMGARVIVTEVNPVRALQAFMDGHQVMKMDEVCKYGDIFITVTGNKDVITKHHVEKMKSGAILANSGHFNVEIDTTGIKKTAKSIKKIRPFVEELSLNNKGKEKIIYLLGEGRLINLAAAEGHPSEVMSLSFCGQALACEWLVKNKNLKPIVYTLPEEIDQEISKLQLKSMQIEFDTLTKDQIHYLNSWQDGT